MKRIATIAVLLTMGACSTLGGPGGRIAQGKALADAWSALGGASVAADTAVKAGLLHGPQAATVSADLKKADAVLNVATAAYQANAPDITSQITVATAAIAEIIAITGAAR